MVVGLAVYKDNFRWASIGYSYSKDCVVIQAVCHNHHSDDALERVITCDLKNQRTAVKYDSASTTEYPMAKRMEFRIKGSKDKYVLSFREEGGEWRRGITVDTKHFTANDFTGTLFGVFATGEEGAKYVFAGLDIVEVPEEEERDSLPDIEW